MAFVSPIEARERILLYGEPGTGKTKQIIEVIKFLKVTKTPFHAYAIDNDRSWKLMVDKHNLEDYVTVYEVYEYPEYMEAAKKIIPKLHPNDLYICDLASELWPTTQEYYTDQMYHDDIGKFFLDAMTSGKDHEFEGWTDWKVINKLYFSFMRPFVYKSPCHVFATSTADPVMRPKSGANASKVADDKETISIFGSVGYKPEGQKRLKHQFNTTILMHKDSRDKFIMSSVKDRERELFRNKPVNNFALDYLKGVAGWQLK